jgi:hypothetical protein
VAKIPTGSSHEVFADDEWMEIWLHHPSALNASVG